MINLLVNKTLPNDTLDLSPKVDTTESFDFITIKLLFLIADKFCRKRNKTISSS